MEGEGGGWGGRGSEGERIVWVGFKDGGAGFTVREEAVTGGRRSSAKDLLTSGIHREWHSLSCREQGLT